MRATVRIFSPSSPPQAISNKPMGRKEKLTAMTQTAMLTAVMAVLAQIAVPMPSQVPLTLQTFGVTLCAWLGGKKTGVPALLVYLAAGAAGMPVFTGFRGGAAVFFGYTGGFLWGFIPLVLLCAAASEKTNRLPAVLAGGAGLLCCHLFGILQYSAVSGSGLWQSFLLCSLPYLLKDALSVLAAYFAASSVRRALRASGIHI